MTTFLLVVSLGSYKESWAGINEIRAPARGRCARNLFASSRFLKEIVMNCGCCGEEDKESGLIFKRAQNESSHSFASASRLLTLSAIDNEIDWERFSSMELLSGLA